MNLRSLCGLCSIGSCKLRPHHRIILRVWILIERRAPGVWYVDLRSFPSLVLYAGHQAMNVAAMLAEIHQERPIKLQVLAILR